MSGTATKLHVLDCGSMSCDLTWLLLKPGRSIRPQADRDKPVEWYPCSTHAVVVETPEGPMLWDTSCPRDWETRWIPTGLQEFLPCDRVTRSSTSTGTLPSSASARRTSTSWSSRTCTSTTVSGDTEFLPGVTLIETPGHTPEQTREAA